MKKKRKTERKNLRLQEASGNFDHDHVIGIENDQDRNLENMKEEFPLKIEIITIVILIPDLRLVINIPAAAEVIDHDLDQMIEVTTTAVEDDLDQNLVIGAEEEVTSPASVPQIPVKDTENVIVNEIVIVIPDHTKDVRDHDHGRILSEDLVRKSIKLNYLQ